MVVADSEDAPHAPADHPPIDHDRGESVSELVEQVGRDAGTLAFRELQLAGSRQLPTAGRTGRTLAVAAVGIVSLVTGVALANWAAVVALSNLVPSWLAALLLAAAWAIAGLLLLASVRRRVSALGVWSGDPDAVVKERERIRDDAEAELRGTLDRLAGAIAADAEGRIRDAISSVPDGVVDVGDEILDAADDLTDAIGEAVPGGGVVNGVLDLVLLPGRTFVKVARVVTVPRVGDDESPTVDPASVEDRALD